MMPDNTDVFHVSELDLKELYNKKNLCVSHVEGCKDENCEWCEYLCSEGYIISCDGCGRINHETWKLWTRIIDRNGGCTVFCPNCSSRNTVSFRDRESIIRKESEPTIVPSVLFDQETVNKMNWKEVFGF